MNVPFPDLILATGTQAALRLVAERGGQRVYIPTEERLTDDCPLARIVGADAAARLAKRWPGQWATVPRAMGYIRRLRDKEIRERRSSSTAAALAREFELTERTVYTIWGEEEAQESQASLF